MRRELSEKEILDTVRDIRHEAPGIGAYKLYLMLKELYSDQKRGRDWFYGLMHESHLMLKPGKRRHTTSSSHPYRKYKNMIKGLTVNSINQLWVADITYIDTDESMAYLHLLTDTFTHEIIGWVLSDSLVASNTVTALDMGILCVSHQGIDGLIHHSNRSVQYCCNQYIDRLQAIKATISMTEDYKPTDNAIAERVNGIIKQEWLYRMKRPPDVLIARELLTGIIGFYNNRRPHRSNKDMLPPARFREALTCMSSLNGGFAPPAVRLPPLCFFHGCFAWKKKNGIFAAVNRFRIQPSTL